MRAGNFGARAKAEKTHVPRVFDAKKRAGETLAKAGSTNYPIGPVSVMRIKMTSTKEPLCKNECTGKAGLGCNCGNQYLMRGALGFSRECGTFSRKEIPALPRNSFPSDAFKRAANYESMKILFA
jgi:hypothetical protein